MTLSNYSHARAKFFSSLESVGEFNLVGPDLAEDVTLKLKDLKGLISYFSAIMSREPIVKQDVEVMTPFSKIADESLNYEAFLVTTKLNDNMSFYFQATTFVNKAPLLFNDKGLLGEKNEYKPFDSHDSKSLDTMLTATIDEIRTFSEDTFKFKHYRGTAAFDRAITHTKGYTIYLIDKGLYMTIIASRHNTKTGINSYIAIMYVGD